MINGDHHHVTRIAKARVEVVDAELPGRCAATSTYVDGVVWLVVDRSKPDADAHLRELVAEYPPLWCHIMPTMASVPRPRTAPEMGRWLVLAAAILTGASSVVQAWGPITLVVA